MSRGFALGIVNGLKACEECVREIKQEFERLNLDYSVEYHPFRRGVEVIDNSIGHTQLEFQTLGETLIFFQNLQE